MRGTLAVHVDAGVDMRKYVNACTPLIGTHMCTRQETCANFEAYTVYMYIYCTWRLDIYDIATSALRIVQLHVMTEACV